MHLAHQVESQSFGPATVRLGRNSGPGLAPTLGSATDGPAVFMTAALTLGYDSLTHVTSCDEEFGELSRRDRSRTGL
jgi:hypothetical protein